MEAKLLRPTLSAPSLFSTSSKPNCAFDFPRHKTSFLVNPATNLGGKRFISLKAFDSSDGSTPGKKRIDVSENLTLDHTRRSLIRQEDSIIFGLLERAQYCYNSDTYDPDAVSIDGFHGSLVQYILKETEKLHAQVGRYKSPDEHPFFPDGLPEPMLPPLHYPKALSKRIHYGKFVAEAKFQAAPDQYKEAIIAQDKDELMGLLTYPAVEEAIKRRVEEKTKTYGMEMATKSEDCDTEPVYKIKPSLVADIYGDWIMPLTKEVQVAYLLRRLD